MTTLLAEGRSFNTLQVLQDGRLKPGSEVQFRLDLLNIPGAERPFDFFGAEAAFRPFMPAGLEVIDVSGERDSEGPFGLVQARVSADAEVSGLILPVVAAVVGFVAAHWAAIAIGGAILATIVIGIRMIGTIIEQVERGISLVLIAVGGALVLAIAMRRGRVATAT